MSTAAGFPEWRGYLSRVHDYLKSPFPQNPVPEASPHDAPYDGSLFSILTINTDLVKLEMSQKETSTLRN